MQTLDTEHSTEQRAERTNALNYFKATLEQMPMEIKKHPILQTATETMEHYIAGEGTDGERRHIASETSDLDFNTRTLDPSCGFDVANNPLSGLADTASCTLADNLDDIFYTSYACDLALIMQ